MYNAINITFDKDELDYKQKYEFNNTDYGMEVYLILNENEIYEDVITNYDNIRKDINEYLNDISKLDQPVNIELYKYLINKEDNFYKKIFDKINYVSLEGTNEQIMTFLNNNPSLKNKEIILAENYDLNTSISEIEKLEELFKNYTNINVILEGNKLPIKLSDYKKTLEKINNITDEINKYNFSELEKVMYVYDKVRDALYIEEDEKESALVSRDLTNVLLGDKRVCEGYANIFNAILKKLNINGLVYRAICSKEKVGHAYNVAYINDKKYNVKGIYFFDTTYDNRKNNTNEYLYGYRFFALSKKTIERYHHNKYDNDRTFKEYSDENIKELIELIKNDKLNEGNEKLIKTINKINYLIEDQSLITRFRLKKDEMFIPSQMLKERDTISNEDLIKEIEKINKYMNSKIDLSTLIKVLYNVRKIEYYNNPEKYPFDVNNIKCIVRNSYWNNENLLKVFAMIFGDENARKQIKSEDEIIKENNIDLNIERIKLTKTLRKVLENNNK